MTRQVLQPIDQMRIHRDEARDKIDRYFADQLKQQLHRDTIHELKRAAAERLIGGGQHDLLDTEAQLRGMAPIDLAKLIVSKPNDLFDRENRRQKIFQMIEQAADPQALADILTTISSL
jgi:hypothetical protein